MDEGSVTDRSEFSPRPRPHIPKLALDSNREQTFVREVSNTSTQPVFGQHYTSALYRDKQLPVINEVNMNRVPRQQYIQNTYHSNNPVTIERRMPNESTFTSPLRARSQKMADGTILTTTTAPIIINRPVEEVAITNDQ